MTSSTWPPLVPTYSADPGDAGAGEWIAVTGGDVYTGTGSYLRGATILAKDGKIESIGYNLFIPEDAERLDSSGMRVYPGLVAIASSGLLGGSGNLKDTIDPFSSRMV